MPLITIGHKFFYIIMKTNRFLLYRMSLPTNRNPQKSKVGKNYPFFEVQEICGVAITNIAQSLVQQVISIPKLETKNIKNKRK